MINVKVEKLPYEYDYQRLMGDSIKKSNSSSNGFQSTSTSQPETHSSTVGPNINGSLTYLNGTHKRKCLSDQRTNNYDSPSGDDTVAENNVGKKLKSIAINKENRKMFTNLSENSIKSEHRERDESSPALSTSPTLSSLSSSASVDSSLSSSPLAFLHGLSTSIPVNDFITPSSLSSLNYLNLFNRSGYANKQEEMVKFTLSSAYKVNYCRSGTGGTEAKNTTTQFKLKNNYANNFLHNLKDYIQSQPFDTCLVVNRTSRVKAHRIVLVAGSDFFRKYFENQHDSLIKKDHAEEHVREISLEDECLSDVELFRLCIDYMYSMGVSFHLPKHSLLKLKRIAQYLQLNDLVQLIANLLQNDDFLNLLQQQQLATQAQLIPSSFAIPPQQAPHSSIPAAMLQLATAMATTSTPSSSLPNPNSLNDFYTIFLKQIYENTLRQSQNTPPVQSELSKSTPNLSQLQANRPAQASTLNPKQNHPMGKKSPSVEQLIKFEPTLRLKLTEMVRVHKRSFEIDTLTRDLLIKDKYVYPSMLNSENDLSVINQQLDKCFENYLYINMDNYMNQLNSQSSATSSSANDFQRHTIILFSLSILNETSFRLNNNFLIKAKLNFTDLNVLKEDLVRILEFFLNRVFVKCLECEANDLINNLMRIVVNRVCYLKKPSNCKTIKLETIKSSTDCFRAIVEYSRLNELNELPYVLLTTHSTVYFN